MKTTGAGDPFTDESTTGRRRRQLGIAGDLATDRQLLLDECGLFAREHDRLGNRAHANDEQQRRGPGTKGRHAFAQEVVVALPGKGADAKVDPRRARVAESGKRVGKCHREFRPRRFANFVDCRGLFERARKHRQLTAAHDFDVELFAQMPVEVQDLAAATGEDDLDDP